MKATILYSMISAVVITIMASCAKEDVANSAFDTDPRAVKVTAGVGDIHSRANPVVGDATQFNAGDQVAISNGSQFRNYTLKDAAWFPTIASEYLKWETNRMTFNAYYPTTLGTSTTTFTVPIDQSTTEKIQGADWMTCAVEKSKGVVNLTFTRQMARVIIKIGSFGNQYAEDKQTVSNVIVNSITPFNQNGNGVDATFTALVKPTTDADANATFVTLTDGNGNQLTVKGTPAMAKGNSYTYTLRVGKDKVTIAEVTVSNWETGEIIGGESAVPTINNSANDTDKAANTLGTALEDKFGADYATKIKTIKVTGSINQADFTSLQAFEYIDLSEVDVVGEIDVDIESKVQQGNAIPMDAFNSTTTLKEINLPHAITTIGKGAFYQCETLTGTLTIPAGVTRICAYAFNACTGFTGILTIPAGVTAIGDYAFSSTNFTELAGFSEKLESIGKNVFNGCSEIKGTLIIPATVKEIANDAFNGLSEMDVIEVSWTNATDILEIHDTPESTFGARTFPYTFWKEGGTKSITVPKGTLELYQAKAGWSFYNLTEKI